MKALISLLAATLLIGAAPPAPDSLLQGFWRNPKGTVEVRIAPCATGLCGTVVSASAAAAQDARDSGYATLVGMELLRGYRAAGRAVWRGTIFVPDMGRSFSSRIELVDGVHARVSGCLIGGFLCKSQLWRRA